MFVARYPVNPLIAQLFLVIAYEEYSPAGDASLEPRGGAPKRATNKGIPGGEARMSFLIKIEQRTRKDEAIKGIRKKVIYNTERGKSEKF
jgi:hypothetical protein